MLVVQVPVLVVLLVVWLHALVWPQASRWRVQLLLRVVHPLRGEQTKMESEKIEEAENEEEEVSASFWSSTCMLLWMLSTTGRRSLSSMPCQCCEGPCPGPTTRSWLLEAGMVKYSLG